MARAMRRSFSMLLLIALGVLVLGGVAPAGAGAAQSAPRVEVFEASGVIDASVLGALRRDLAGAERRGAAVLLIQLDSFGSLGVDPADLVGTVEAARVPVAVWVGPRSARAAGAATFLLAGADVVAVSRDARVGPALPAELGRGRRPQAEERLVAETKLPAQVERAGAGGAQAEALGLAAYALVVLPTNWLALGVLLAGFGLFSIDAAVGGLGLGTAAATALTAAGSWWLFSSPSPLLRLDGRLAAAGVAWSVLWFVVLLTVLLRSQRQLPLGTEALVGARGVVRSMLNPGGIVTVEGAMWRADLIGGGSLATGQRVAVEAVREGILQVGAEDPGAVRPSRRRGRHRRRPPATGAPPASDGSSAEAEPARPGKD